MLIDVTETDRRGIDPKFKVESVHHAPMSVNETFDESAKLDIMDIDPLIIQQSYHDVEDSNNWGKSPYDYCSERDRDLILNMKCTYFSKSEVTIQHAKTKWCQKSDKFCDFKTGIFSELKSYRANIDEQ
jgi:hypothetical protein